MLTVATLVVMVGIALLGFVGHTSSGALLLALITLRFATRNATKLSSKNNSELHTVGALFLLARPAHSMLVVVRSVYAWRRWLAENAISSDGAMYGPVSESTRLLGTRYIDGIDDIVTILLLYSSWY